MASAQKEHRGAQRQKQPRHERHKLFRDAHGFRQAAAHAKEQKPRKYNARKHARHTHGYQHRRCRAGLRHGAHAERRKHTACGINFCAVPPERLLHIADRAGGVFRAEFCRQNALGIYGHHAEKRRNPHPDDRARAADQDCRRNAQNIPRAERAGKRRRQ